MNEVILKFNKDLPIRACYLVDGKQNFIYYNKHSIVKKYSKNKNNELLIEIAKRYVSIKRIENKLTSISIFIDGDDFIRNEKKLIIQWIEKP